MQQKQQNPIINHFFIWDLCHDGLVIIYHRDMFWLSSEYHSDIPSHFVLNISSDVKEQLFF